MRARLLLLAAAVVPFAVTALAHGCSNQQFESACLWIADPDNCLRVFREEMVANVGTPDNPNGEAAPKNFVRLRLAVLEDSPHASADLHQSILEHGPGWWGARRSNLALLAPRASLHDALAFAIKYKLACWGVFTYGGLDDAYVVPGPYGEL